MNKQEIENYNRLCAEFLGYTVRENGCYNGDDKLVNKLSFLQLRDLKFHSDWNWIMVVVQAINKTQNPRKGGDTTHSTLKIEIRALLGKVEKEAVVQSINQFLIWYNEHTSKF